MTADVLQVTEVSKTYPGRSGRSSVHAIRDVTLTVRAGSSLGIVGESGCGKSTLGRVIVGLESASAGRVEVAGHVLDARRRDPASARRIQLVFQDPFSSLNPRRTVSQTLSEVILVHGLASGTQAIRARVDALLAMVALGPRFADRLPHEMSGGQAQRVAIARALAAEPQILVLDEPTSALDVSVRAEIVNLLIDLNATLGLSYVFISHDMAVIRHISDVVAVMYLGRVVESGPVADVFDRATHPYTRALLDAVPVADPDQRLLDPEVTPAPLLLGADLSTERGCLYRPRCPLRVSLCDEVDPALVGAQDHRTACHVTSPATATTASPLG